MFYTTRTRYQMWYRHMRKLARRGYDIIGRYVQHGYPAYMGKPEQAAHIAFCNRFRVANRGQLRRKNL